MAADRQGSGRPQMQVAGAGGLVRLSLSGELDLGWSTELHDALGTALARTGDGGRLVVDLSEAEFLDCAALGVLIATAHEAVRRHVSLELTGDTGVVARMLQLASARDLVPSGCPRLDTVPVTHRAAPPTTTR